MFNPFVGVVRSFSLPEFLQSCWMNMRWTPTLLIFGWLWCISNAKMGSLSRQRIYSEFRDIADQGLTLDVPFNTSSDECGIRLSPMKKNMLDWHFSFTGVEGSHYEGGIYHGTISLDSRYPRKAPIIRMSTPSGRWKVNEDICLSASAHHPELWDPSWNLRTLILSLRGFMTTQPNEIGSTRTSAAEKEFLCEQSKNYICPHCHIPHQLLVPRDPNSIIERTGFVLRNSKLLLSGTRLIPPASISTRRKHAQTEEKRPFKATRNKKKGRKSFRGDIFKTLKSRNVHNLMRFAVVVTGSMLIRELIDSILKILVGVLSTSKSSF